MVRKGAVTGNGDRDGNQFKVKGAKAPKRRYD